MKKQLIQSRTTDNTTRSKDLYFYLHIFYYLFRCKHDLRINSRFRYLDYPFQQYLSKTPTLLSFLVIVGFFLSLKQNNHIIITLKI